jgi:hypothetical protein
MRGSAVAKWAEPTQKIELLLAESGNFDERLGSRQHREQTQKQDLLERIEHLAGLARIRQIRPSPQPPRTARKSSPSVSLL